MDDHHINVIVSRSAGLDGAVLVMIDTSFEPDGSDGSPGLRVLVNDGWVFTGSGGDGSALGGVDYVANETDDDRPATQRELGVDLKDLVYVDEKDKETT